MKFKEFTAKNFVCYEQLRLTFDSGLTLVDGFNHDTGQANGCGKSVLFSAIAYSVYKRLVTGVNLQDLVPPWGDLMVETNVLLEVPQGEVRIIRTCNPSSVRLWLNGLEFKANANKVEERIIGLVGLSFEQFLQIAYFYQRARDRFADINDTEKKSFLAAILGLDRFESGYKAAHVAVQVAENAAAIEKAKAQVLEGAMASVQQSLKLAEEALAEHLRQQPIAEKQAKERRDFTIATTGTDSGDRLREATKRLQEAEVALAVIPAVDRVKLNERHELWTKGKEAIVKFQTDLKIAEGALSQSIQSSSEICPTCLQSLPEDRTKFEAVTVSLQERLKTIREKLVKAEKLVLHTQDAPELLVKAATAEAEARKLKDEIGLARRDLDEIAKITIRQKQLAASAQTTYEAELAAIERDRVRCEKAITNEATKLEHFRSQENTAKASAASKLEEANYYKELKTIFGPLGLRAQVVDSVIADLNEHIAHYVEVMFDGRVHFRYDLGEDGKIVGRLEFEGKNRTSLATLSGGQLQRVRLAIDLALADVVSHRLAVRPNIMLLDEVTGGLDSMGRETLMTLLQEAERSRDMILVSDHESEFKARFSNTIRLNLRDGKTTMTIGV